MRMCTHFRVLVLVLPVLCWTLPAPSVADAEDGYVVEDMNLIQNDQPEQRFHPQRTAFAGAGPGKAKVHIPPDMVLTKEILVKQGKLRGFVRFMHAQTGLRDVDQYLGIPYAAPPTGNGRFMPPGESDTARERKPNNGNRKCVPSMAFRSIESGRLAQVRLRRARRTLCGTESTECRVKRAQTERNRLTIRTECRQFRRGSVQLRELG